MMSQRILSAALLLCTLAACGEHPTGSDTHARPAGPAYDGGFGVGSGNSAVQSGYGIGSGNGISGPTDEPLPSTTTAGDSTGRGGFGVGSGN